MNADRIATLTAWQEASRIEREALVGARDAVNALIVERDAEDYPRAGALDAEILSLDRSTLSLLVSWQDDTRADREALIAARDALPDDGEGQRFSALTREIAKADEEILARAEEIEALATLANA